MFVLKLENVQTEIPTSSSAQSHKPLMDKIQEHRLVRKQNTKKNNNAYILAPIPLK